MSRNSEVLTKNKPSPNITGTQPITAPTRSTGVDVAKSFNTQMHSSKDTIPRTRRYWGDSAMRRPQRGHGKGLRVSTSPMRMELRQTGQIGFG